MNDNDFSLEKFKENLEKEFCKWSFQDFLLKQSINNWIVDSLIEFGWNMKISKDDFIKNNNIKILVNDGFEMGTNYIVMTNKQKTIVKDMYDFIKEIKQDEKES